ncbi:MAG: ABC transporter permease [Dehalococcoidia bacterium]
MAAKQATAEPYDFTKQTLHTKERGLWGQAFQRLARNRLALASGLLLLLIAALAVLSELGTFVQNNDPAIQNYQNIRAAPSGNYWLGTDGLGRDLWSRLMQGTLFSLKLGLITQVFVLVIGISVGMGAALGGKRGDGVLMWFTDLAYAFPDLLAIILMRQILFGRGWPIIGEGNPQIPGFGGVFLVTVIAIGLVAWVTVARLVRGQMLQIKQQDYVLAAQATGASPWRVVRYHMLPNTLSAIIVATTFGIPLAIFAEAALSFIGLGVPPPDASLGSLIRSGQDNIQTNSIELIWPAVMVAILMLCFTFLGDGLRDALDPRTRK